MGRVGLNYMISSFCCTTSLHATPRNALIHFLLTYLQIGLLAMLLAISVPYLNLFIGVPFLGLDYPLTLTCNLPLALEYVCLINCPPVPLSF